MINGSCAYERIPFTITIYAKLMHSGQVLLITMLVMAVATTIGLALASRSTQDVNISTQVEESSRAFSAAEAGIEEGTEAGVRTRG